MNEGPLCIKDHCSPKANTELGKDNQIYTEKKAITHSFLLSEYLSVMSTFDLVTYCCQNCGFCILLHSFCWLPFHNHNTQWWPNINVDFHRKTWLWMKAWLFYLLENGVNYKTSALTSNTGCLQSAFYDRILMAVFSEMNFFSLVFLFSQCNFVPHCVEFANRPIVFCWNLIMFENFVGKIPDLKWYWLNMMNYHLMQCKNKHKVLSWFVCTILEYTEFP